MTERYDLAQALPGLDGWTRDQSDAALVEGWDIFDCDGSENGRAQICCIDEADILENDNRAWELVSAKAAEGGALHVAAMAFVEQHNPKEHRAIIQWCQRAALAGAGA